MLQYLYAAIILISSIIQPSQVWKQPSTLVSSNYDMKTYYIKDKTNVFNFEYDKKTTEYVCEFITDNGEKIPAYLEMVQRDHIPGLQERLPRKTDNYKHSGWGYKEEILLWIGVEFEQDCYIKYFTITGSDGHKTIVNLDLFYKSGQHKFKAGEPYGIGWWLSLN